MSTSGRAACLNRSRCNGQPLTIPALVPFLSDTPGRTDWPGPDIGAHNQEVLGGLLGYSAADLDRLRQAGVI